MRWVCHGHKHLGGSNNTHWFLVQGSDCNVSTQKRKPWFCDGEGCIWRPPQPSSEWQSRVFAHLTLPAGSPYQLAMLRLSSKFSEA